MFLLFAILIFLAKALAAKIHHFQTSQLYFSGYSWNIRNTKAKQGPGPNYFSNHPSNVWVDENSYLHMKIRQQNDIWYCSQINLDRSYGYGSYIFNMQKKCQQIDPNIVLGLFTYLNDTQQIDIQLSQWNNPNNQNTQYVVQPHQNKGNQYRFQINNNETQTIHAFTWTQSKILFQTFQAENIAEVQIQIGKVSKSTKLVKQWIYTGKDIPKESTQRARLNLWLYKGQPPINGFQQEVIIRQFKFKSQKIILQPTFRQIDFSGYTWNVRSTQLQQQGPGPNYFSNDIKNVWVDNNSHLHMKIRYQDSKWFCSQIILGCSYGYGSYIFNLEKGFKHIDQRVTLGLLTYLDKNNEIDISISQSNTRYIVQPSNIQGNNFRFFNKMDQSIFMLLHGPTSQYYFNHFMLQVQQKSKNKQVNNLFLKKLSVNGHTQVKIFLFRISKKEQLIYG